MKKNKDTSPYEQWTEQSKYFFDSANQYLEQIFKQNKQPNPLDYSSQIESWLEALKKQWEYKPKKENNTQDYFKIMTNMYQEAADLMLLEWIKRSRESNPVKSIQELYELWLASCFEIYQKSIQSKSYQETYGDFMKMADKFWEGVGK